MNLFLPIRAVWCLTAAFVLLVAQVQAQAPALVVDRAAVLPSLAPPGQGTLYDLVERTDALGNTYQAGSFSGTVQFGGFALTSAGTTPGLDTNVFVAKRDAAGTYLWAIASNSSGELRAKAIAIDAAGNAYVAGHFASPTATFGTVTLTNRRPANTGTADVFVAKVGAAGTWQWAAGAGGGTTNSGNDYACVLAVDVFGNVYVAGTYTSSVAFFGTLQLPTSDPANGGRATVFVAKLDGTGAWQWARRGEYFGGEVRGLAVDAAGAAYLATETPGRAWFGPFTVTDPPNARGTVVAKLDGAGAWKWLAHARSTRSTRVACSGLTLGPQGDLYVAGAFSGDTATFGRTHLFNFGPLRPNLNGGAPNQHTDNAYLARLDAGTGTWRWAGQSHGDGNEYITSVLPDGLGELYAGLYTSEPDFPHQPIQPGHRFGATTVYTAGGADVLIAQLDTAGTWRWVAQAGGAANEGGEPRYLDAQRQVVVAGTFEGPALRLGAYNLMAAPTARAIGPAFTAFTARLGPTAPLAAQPATGRSAFAVYPNPARHHITVAGLPTGQQVQVFDLLGRQVLGGTVPERGFLQLALPASLASGLYLVRAGQQARRLLVE